MLRYLGDIRAGFPSAAEGYEDQPLNLQDLLVPRPAATFFYTVRGDLLRHEYLRDGAILVVDRSLKPAIGKLVIVEDCGDMVVCRYRNHRVVVGIVVAAITRF